MSAGSRNIERFRWLLEPNALDLQSPVFLLVLALVVTVIYGNTLFNGYSVDDNLIVDGNVQAEAGFESIPEIFSTNYLTHGDQQGAYRAIPRATFAIEMEIFGRNPAVSHAINLLLFLLTCLLLLRLLVNLFPEKHGTAIWIAVVLFALHPIHTEVVASLKNRDELLQLLFNLLACLGLIGFLRSGRWRQLALAALAFLVALMCKESAVQFLAVFALISFYSGSIFGKRSMAAGIAMVVPLIAFIGFMIHLNADALLWMDKANQEFLFIEHPLMHTEDPLTKIGTGLYGLIQYIKLYVFPHPLGFYYGFNQVELVSLMSAKGVLSSLILLSITALAVLQVSKKSLLGFGLMAMLICFAIFSNLIIQVSGIIAERFAYSSSLGFCIAAGWIFEQALSRTDAIRKIGVVAFLLLVVSAGAKTITRNADWNSYLSLSRADVEHFPESAVTHLYLANYIQKNILDTAIADPAPWIDEVAYAYAEVKRIHPESASVCRYAAMEASSKISPDSAFMPYEILIRGNLSQDQPNDHIDYAQLLIESGNRAKASEILQLRLDHHQPDEATYKVAAENLLLMNETERLTVLIDQMDKHLMKGDLPAIYRGNLALASGNKQDAIEQFKLALSINPENPDLKTYLQQLESNAQ